MRCRFCDGDTEAPDHWWRCDGRQGWVESRIPPLARNSDPETSHVAAALIEPTRKTKKGRVLAFLKERRGEWVLGYQLMAPDVGGSEGLRRERELRAAGWNIEREPVGSGRTTWRYRLR